MEKMYVLQNENTIDLALNSETLIKHFESCRKENEVIEKDYLSRNPDDVPIHLNWNNREIMTIEDAVAYYNEVLEGYDYYALFILDPKAKNISSKITNIHNSKKFTHTQELGYTVGQITELFNKLGAKRDNDTELYRISQSDTAEGSVDTVEDIDFLKIPFNIAYA